MLFLTLGADMTRPSRTGGKTREAKARNASPAKGRKTTKTKLRIAPAATRVKRSVSGPSKDLKEAREQQAATAEILKVIATSPDDVQPVLEAVAQRAMSLLDAWSVLVTQFDGELLHFGAACGALPDTEQFLRNLYPTRPEAAVFAGRCILERSAINISDALADPSPQNRDRARLRGFRAALSVPMLRNGHPIGVITVSRREAGAFSINEVGLLQTFADQAVIAIENTRLFNETKDALERQTATADILRVIASSPSDVQPVFEAIATSANRLIGSYSATVFRFVDGICHLAAFTQTTPAADEVLKATFPRPVAEFRPFELAQTGKVVQVTDTDAETDAQMKDIARARGFRSALLSPLMSKETPIGLITVTRVETGSFAAHHVQLLQTFADQAVIAIENVRLFNEVQARTNDLGESLRQQTATGDVLKVIASSPTNVEPVLQAIVESACAFCGAYDAGVVLKIGDDLHFSAHHGPIRTGQQPRPINRQWVTGRSVIDKVPVQVSDFQAPDAAEFPEGQRQSREQGHRCTLSVPLLREGEAIGAIVLRRLEPVAFSDKQMALLQTFADQAVIAIGNVRLFDEVQAKTRDLTEALEQQTATADVLQVISSSPGDLQPVFKSMLNNALRICEAKFGQLLLYDGRGLLPAELHNSPADYARLFKSGPLVPGPNTGLGRLIASKEVIHIPDVMAGTAYAERDPLRIATVEILRARTLLAVPMLKDTDLVGAIVIYRQEVRPFSDRQIETVTNFAAQAVIAIENTRLLKELRERTDDLTLSLNDLRTAQDRLVQTEKLASLGQLTAGIAHEIKNPLNFVNNFSALSADLTDELNDVLRPVAMDGKVRAEVGELTGLLKDNLEKVVQHGKRADSIVKNMLLHSREGSGEHRPADINSLLDESLNLAYHGARAEKGEFNITLQRDFDADAGTIVLFPQEITRAFLNLIANGVYAATRRKMEDKEPGFEPILLATTKNLGATVEIRIRDNGTGIPPEVKEKIFNPFFTTKPAGEGTGLGLSITHDIIVKQHGGRIDVTTEPGQFTEFTIVLPRKSIVSGTDRGKP
jgi:signal transduction histidine kinase